MGRRKMEEEKMSTPSPPPPPPEEGQRGREEEREKSIPIRLAQYLQKRTSYPRKRIRSLFLLRGDLRESGEYFRENGEYSRQNGEREDERENGRHHRKRKTESDTESVMSETDCQCHENNLHSVNTGINGNSYCDQCSGKIFTEEISHTNSNKNNEINETGYNSSRNCNEINDGSKDSNRNSNKINDNGRNSHENNNKNSDRNYSIGFKKRKKNYFKKSEFLIRNNSTQSSIHSATTTHTLLSSASSTSAAASRDGAGYSCWEDLGNDNVIDGVQVIAERDMNSFQKHIPGLQRHDAKTSTIRQHYYPEGGWGWLVCACVFVVHVLTSGLQFSFGVLLTDMLQHVGQHRAMDACWVGSCCLAVSRATSPLVVALCRRKSTRLTAVIGGLVMALAVLFASFAIHLHQIFLSYGLVLGIGVGMTRETANLMLGQYFKRRREFVEIISQSGCGIGITLFSVFFKEAIRSVGWRLGLQAVTGVVFSAFFLGIFYRSASLYHPQRRAILHLKNQKRKQVKDKHKADYEKPPYFDVTCLKLRSVRVLLATAALSSAGLYTPLFFLVLGAQREGLEDSALILLQTFLGFAYALGCIGFGLIVVRQSEQCLISRQYLCQAALYGLGVTMLALTAIHDYHGYVLFNWLYGVMLGGAHYSFQMLTLEKVRARHFSRAWGFIQGATALPVLIGIPVTGYINESNPKTGYFLASVFLLCGASCLFFLNYYKEQMSKQHDTSVSFTTVDSHLTHDPPYALPLENGNGRNGTSGASGGNSGSSGQRDSSNSGRDSGTSGRECVVTSKNISGLTGISGLNPPPPVCTCGAESSSTTSAGAGGAPPPPPALSPPTAAVPMDHKSHQQALSKLGKTISFATSVDVMEPRLKPELLTCISEEGIYYDYMMDCMSTCRHDTHYYTECGGPDALECDGDDEEEQIKAPLKPVRGPTRLPLHHLAGRKLRQASGVSFSEPEGLARLGQGGVGVGGCIGYRSSGHQHHPQQQQPKQQQQQQQQPKQQSRTIPQQPPQYDYGSPPAPLPRAPILRRPPPSHPRRSITVIEEMTTSV